MANVLVVPFRESEIFCGTFKCNEPKKYDRG